MALLPFSHQREVFNILLTRAKLYFDHRWLEFPVRPRFHSLIAGPTGTGKTTIASHLAATLGTGFFRVSCPEWMPMGAHNRGAAETFPLILKHLESVNNLILFIDEIDKLWDTNSSWQDYARSELFDLLDGKIPVGIKLDGESDGNAASTARLVNLARKITRHTFVVSAGTFQAQWETAHTKTIGFGGGQGSQLQPSLSVDDMARRLPRELINRFHSQILSLRRLDRADYVELARSTAFHLPEWIRAKFSDVALARIDQAFEAQKGCRFVEEALLIALQIACEKEEISKDKAI